MIGPAASCCSRSFYWAAPLALPRTPRRRRRSPPQRLHPRPRRSEGLAPARLGVPGGAGGSGSRRSPGRRRVHRLGHPLVLPRSIPCRRLDGARQTRRRHGRAHPGRIRTRTRQRVGRLPARQQGSPATPKPDGWPPRRSRSRTHGGRPGRSAPRCAQSASSRAATRASRRSNRRSMSSRARGRSSNTPKRVPSWEPRFTAPTGERRHASTSAEHSSSRRAVARRRSPPAPISSYAPPARGHGASPCAASSRSLPASGASPN
jgi:hypothetical protein